MHLYIHFAKHYLTSSKCMAFQHGKPVKNPVKYNSWHSIKSLKTFRSKLKCYGCWSKCIFILCLLLLRLLVRFRVRFSVMEYGLEPLNILKNIRNPKSNFIMFLNFLGFQVMVTGDIFFKQCFLSSQWPVGHRQALIGLSGPK